jgi:predicted transcriptional regulator
MMITKEKIIESIKAMPEEKFEDIDILLEHIVLLEKIETGLKDIEDGNTHTNEEMNQIIESWFQK